MTIDIDMIPDRALIRAAHGTEGVLALIRAYAATKAAQDEAHRRTERAFRRGEAKANPTEVADADKANAAAYAAEQALHRLWRSMGYCDCPTASIGMAIEWSL